MTWNYMCITGPAPHHSNRTRPPKTFRIFNNNRAGSTRKSKGGLPSDRLSRDEVGSLTSSIYHVLIITSVTSKCLILAFSPGEADQLKRLTDAVTTLINKQKQEPTPPSISYVATLRTGLPSLFQSVQLASCESRLPALPQPLTRHRKTKADQSIRSSREWTSQKARLFKRRYWQAAAKRSLQTLKKW